MAIAKAVNSFLTFSRNASQELVTNLLLCSPNARQRSVAIFAACTVRRQEFTAPRVPETFRYYDFDIPPTLASENVHGFERPASAMPATHP
jgi:hypothetical protein